MLKIGLTGARGLIGWHLSSRLKTENDLDTIAADRSTFESPESLRRFVDSCDVIVHLAGINRGSDEEVRDGNLALAKSLVASLEASGRNPHLIFSSSIHVNGDSLYGKTKLACTDLFSAWSQKSGAKFTNLILPHVFGESGRPFYNSVVSTFCHQIARGEAPTVHGDSSLELLHAQSVASLIVDAIRKPDGAVFTELRPSGHRLSVRELLVNIEQLANVYRSGIIPDLRDGFQLGLFNTYRSYLYPDRYPVSLRLNTDDRGSLFEIVKTNMGGQCFLSTTKPGIARGNHFHLRKIERFLVTSGEAIIRIRKLDSGDIREFRVSGQTPQFIDIPTMHTHNITNVGSTELVTLFWSHEIFDPDFPDTFKENV